MEKEQAGQEAGLGTVVCILCINFPTPLPATNNNLQNNRHVLFGFVGHVTPYYCPLCACLSLSSLCLSAPLPPSHTAPHLPACPFYLPLPASPYLPLPFSPPATYTCLHLSPHLACPVPFIFLPTCFYTLHACALRATFLSSPVHFAGCFAHMAWQACFHGIPWTVF